MSDEIIELVRNYEFLYNPKCKDYKDQLKRTAAWEEIAKKLKLPVEKCKDSWAKLRNAYCSALKRRKTKSGQAATHVTAWKYEDQMNFLRPHMELRNTQTNLSPESPVDITPNSPIDFSNDSQGTSSSHPQDSYKSSDGSQRSSSSKRSFAGKRNPDLEDIYNLFKTSNDLRQERQQSKQNMDESDLFFLSMSKAVKALPKLDQTKIKLDLHKAISEAEIRKMNETERVLKTPLNIISQKIVSSKYQSVQSPASIQSCDSPSSYYGSPSRTDYYKNSPIILQTHNSPPQSLSIVDPQTQGPNTTAEENLATYYESVNFEHDTE